MWNGVIPSTYMSYIHEGIINPPPTMTNIPAEALPAYENDENDYFVTARSDFFSQNFSKKKVHLLCE